MAAPAALADANDALTPNDLNTLIRLGLSNPSSPTMLFGSHARGDAHASSDIDVLQLTRRSFAYSTGALSVTGYRQRDLEAMARRGSLFVLHLRTDGMVVQDAVGELARTIGQWRPPPSYSPLLDALRVVSGALDVSESGFLTNARGYLGLAAFLARTELYARCAQEGRPEFSIARAAARCGVSSIGEMVHQRRGAPAWSRFVALREALQTELDIPCKNPHGSMEALIVELDRLTPTGASRLITTCCPWTTCRGEARSVCGRHPWRRRPARATARSGASVGSRADFPWGLRQPRAR